MKNLIIVILSIVAVVSFMTCAGIGNQEFEEKEHIEYITDTTSESNYCYNKFIEKAQEKSNKDYTWVVYKLWESNNQKQ